MSDMENRLQQFLAAENLSQSQFADAIGVARASVSHILSGRNKPGYDFIVSMSRHFPALNLEWLIIGKGKMYKGGQSAAELTDIAPVCINEPETAPEIPLIPSIDAPSSPESAPSTNINTLDNIDKLIDNQRSIKKVIIFFSDNSFQEIG